MSKETGRKRKVKVEVETPKPTPPSPVPEKVEVMPDDKPRVKCLSCFDKDAKLKLSPDCLRVDGEKGYRMIRGTSGVAEGDCYFEVTINDPIVIGPKYPEAHTRLGWSTEKGNVEAPVGFDKYSYSYRDVKGTKFHQSIGEPYGEAYGPKDVIGCFIRLRDDQPESDLKDLTPLQIQFREQAKHAAMLPLSGSKIMYFKNGVSQGVAFTDIFKGTYFPAIALYMGASVSVNFGPDFKYPPSLGDDLGMIEWGAEVLNPNHLQEEKNRLASAKPAKPELVSPSSPKKSRRRKSMVNDMTPAEAPANDIAEAAQAGGDPAQVDTAQHEAVQPKSEVVQAHDESAQTVTQETAQVAVKSETPTDNTDSAVTSESNNDRATISEASNNDTDIAMADEGESEDT